MNKAAIAREYRDKYGMEIPTKTLARIMYAENDLVFSDVEQARSYLRKIEGKNGKGDGTIISHRMEEKRPYNPYKLPESFAVTREAFRLPKDCKKVLYLPDQHIPYHDIRANTIAIDRGVKDGVDTVIMTGDVLDLHKVSKYQPDPRKRDIMQEFEAAKDYLESLREAFPYAKLLWLKGNHCQRLEKFLLEKAYELWKDPYYHLEERLELNKYRIEIFSDKQIIKAGNLNVTHGHYIINSPWGSVNPAKTVYDKTGKDYLIGHVHKHFEFKKIDADGRLTRCYTMGCLSEIRPDYNPIVSNYMHGFAIQEIDPNTGEYELDNVHIKPNQSYYL